VIGAVTSIPTPSVDWYAIAPDLALFGAAIVIVLGRALMRHHPRVPGAALFVAIAGVAASGVFTAIQWRFVDDDGPYQALRGMVAVDGFAVFVQTVILGATLLGLLV
jgi:NADH-quinone oxidoreductase subunit N